MTTTPEVLHEQTWTHDGRPLLHYANYSAPEGPWWDEPDKIQWVDGQTDLDCLMVRNRLGAWCGYVGVPTGHPLHGKDYDEVDIDVHGSLTFASSCDESAPEGHGICHIPLQGRDPDVWWLGFDCGHMFDLMPGMMMIPSMTENTTYWTRGMVQQECSILAMLIKTWPASLT